MLKYAGSGSARAVLPNASHLIQTEHLLARVLDIFPLILGLACPTMLAWYSRPYLGVFFLALIALKRAFSAPGYLRHSCRTVNETQPLWILRIQSGCRDVSEVLALSS